MPERNSSAASDFELPTTFSNVEISSKSKQTGLMPVVDKNETYVKAFCNSFNHQFVVARVFASIVQLRETALAYGKKLNIAIDTAYSSIAIGVITLQ
ncbi:hypothetical protein [Parasitella parasitica]|uniref:Uncharacterized protein n=1 Tax=Parasitella parasitica TaxID=35722 RepID=A0A0B7MV95_9FUNG|nr:hypothetical protein [Parasitella parasitica]